MEELPKRSTPSFMRLLKTNRDLVDSFSICRVLTTDLYGAKYHAPEAPLADSTESEQGEHVERKRKERPKAIAIQKEITPKKTLKDLVDGESDIDDGDIRQGFVDDEGEDFYIIDKVLRYHPDQGYFVHWKGYPKSDRTWQLPEDMPSGFVKEMKKARERYEKEKLFA